RVRSSCRLPELIGVVQEPLIHPDDQRIPPTLRTGRRQEEQTLHWLSASGSPRDDPTRPKRSRHKGRVQLGQRLRVREAVVSNPNVRRLRGALSDENDGSTLHGGRRALGAERVTKSILSFCGQARRYVTSRKVDDSKAAALGG